MKLNLRIQRIAGLPPVVWVGQAYVSRFQDLIRRHRLHAEQALLKTEQKFTFVNSFEEVEKAVAEFNALNSAGQLAP